MGLSSYEYSPVCLCVRLFLFACVFACVHDFFHIRVSCSAGMDGATSQPYIAGRHRGAASPKKPKPYYSSLRGEEFFKYTKSVQTKIALEKN